MWASVKSLVIWMKLLEDQLKFILFPSTIIFQYAEFKKHSNWVMKA